MTGPPRSIPALSSLCTPLHPSLFYRSSLSLPLRGLHIIPNPSWSTSPSPTSQRRTVVRDTPTPTVDVAYEQLPGVSDDESTASAQAAIAQVVAQSCQAQTKWRRWRTTFICMPPRCIHPYCPRGTFCVIFSPHCANNPRTA